MYGGNPFRMCPECDCDLVYPETARPAGERWRLVLRCPNCSWWESRLFDELAANRLLREQHDDTSVLAAELRDLTRANMTSELEAFVAALAVDAILPMDF